MYPCPPSDFRHIDRTTNGVIGLGLPAAFVGLPLDRLADLSWVGEPLAAIYAGTGFWPVETETPAYDAEIQRVSGQVDEVPDPARRVVTVTPMVVNLTETEIQARRAARAAVPMTPLEFARRLTQAERLAIRASTDPVVVDFLWLLDRASEVRLDDPDTQAGVGHMVHVGLLPPERADAILTP